MKIKEFENLFILLEEINIVVDDDVKKRIKNNIFKVPDNIENLVYWEVVCEYDKFDKTIRQGLITKKEKENLLKLNSNKWYSLDEISKYCYVEFQIKNIKFSTDIDDILDCYNSDNNDSYNISLNDYLDI